jgi:hypothetical protein
MAWLSVSDGNNVDRGVDLTPEQRRRRRNRSIAIGLALGALVLIMIAITLVRGPSVVFTSI